MKTTLKAGEMKIKPEEEEPLWMDIKRITVFALPFSFTKYYLTETRLIVESGLFNKREEEVRLYRVRDILLKESAFEQLNKTGTIIISSADASMPIMKIKHIINPKIVKEIITQQVERCRLKYGVRTSELVGGTIPFNYV